MAHRAVTLLVGVEALEVRRAITTGALAPLAASLRGELERLMREGFEVPDEKALLSRDGGRCERDGTLLVFDPYSRHDHACPRCGAVYRRERDYLWWITSYQLWLAERAVYAATLHTLTGERALAELAEGILDAQAVKYLQYPNRDNALGPTRPFFSTYLESIWLIQVAVALSLLEASKRGTGLGARVRERVIEPSARLIASFDEGDSNRQVWNSAALLAAGRLLGDHALVEQSILGSSGLVAHLARGLLPDGSWYEGENYHVFAHRGLWYAVTFSEQAGCPPPNELVRRFEDGFVLPLLTALPDLTIPSRRDSQYAISLRQWRFAESFELGLARREDARLAAALGRLYGDAGPRHDTGRWRSAADTQPHQEASALTRADLGWRALLFARPTLPKALEATPRSALLEEQGFAVFRRTGGRTYVALDYGHHGGGHGHPDRLNLLLARGTDRILDDYGTGSYVDPSLHWYRSTLAHNAPLFDGISQRRASGHLLAYEERDAAGWVDADVLNGLAPDVRARRSLIVMTDYLVDRLEWESPRTVRAELPIHVPAKGSGLALQEAHLDGGPSPDDGFAFVHDSARAHLGVNAVVPVKHGELEDVEGWIAPTSQAEWWRATGPGPPGLAERSFSLVRVTASAGSITSVWSWERAVTDVAVRDGMLVIHRRDGERHEHARGETGWVVTVHRGRARSSIELAGQRRRARSSATDARTHRVTARKPWRIRSGQTPIELELGEEAYRRSEESWDEAGRPRARVTLSATRRYFVIEVAIEKRDVVFRAPDALDPALDNEHADIHSDGVQLYIGPMDDNRPAAWLSVPEHPAPRVRTRVVDGTRSDIPLAAGWSAAPRGYSMRFEIPLDALSSERTIPLAIDLIVNEMAIGRMRRRGQLVLSGGGGWTYLRGDRQSAARFVPVVIERD